MKQSVLSVLKDLPPNTSPQPWSRPRTFNKGPGLKILCIAGLVMSWVASLVCLVASIVIITKPRIAIATWSIAGIDRDVRGTLAVPKGEWFINASSALNRFLSFLLTAAVTALSEASGVTYSIALRWTLWAEDRLEWNTNLRTLITSHFSPPFRWYSVILYNFFLIISYASASQVFIKIKLAQGHGSGTIVSGMGVLFLGIGLLGQTALATWSFWTATGLIITWDTNTFVTAHVASLNQSDSNSSDHSLGTLTACAKRGNLHEPAKPLPKQPSLYESNPLTKRILIYLWVIFAATLVWLVVWFTVYRMRHSTGGNRLYSDRSNLYVPTVRNQTLVVHLVLLVVSAAMQTVFTLDVHLVEQIVGAIQDELVWRRASTPQGRPSAIGAAYTTEEVLLTLQTPPMLALYVVKAAMHWIFGSTVSSEVAFAANNGTITGNPVTVDTLVFLTFSGWPLVSLCWLCLVIASFATWLAFWKPKGPQPSVFGHITTLACLVDEWGKEGKPIFWGDKGGVNGDSKSEAVNSCHFEDATDPVRCAGTSSERNAVGAIVMDALYA